MNKVNNYCKNCDARCCYDGVYLSKIDEKKLMMLFQKIKNSFLFQENSRITSSHQLWGMNII